MDRSSSAGMCHLLTLMKLLLHNTRLSSDDILKVIALYFTYRN